MVDSLVEAKSELVAGIQGHSASAPAGSTADIASEVF